MLFTSDNVANFMVKLLPGLLIMELITIDATSAIEFAICTSLMCIAHDTPWHWNISTLLVLCEGKPPVAINERVWYLSAWRSLWTNRHVFGDQRSPGVRLMALWQREYCTMKEFYYDIMLCRPQGSTHRNREVHMLLIKFSGRTTAILKIIKNIPFTETPCIVSQMQVIVAE